MDNFTIRHPNEEWIDAQEARLTPEQRDYEAGLTDVEPKPCTCPEHVAGPWDSIDCPAHGEDAACECDAQARAEMAAESAWLRHAEYDPRMDDPREW